MLSRPKAATLFATFYNGQQNRRPSPYLARVLSHRPLHCWQYLWRSRLILEPRRLLLPHEHPFNLNLRPLPLRTRRRNRRLSRQRQRRIRPRPRSQVERLRCIHPCQSAGQFGYFGALPSLTDFDGAIDALEYALDELKADGITLFTSYDGKYLGHKDFESIWAELEKGNAVIFIHPCHTPSAVWASPQLPQPIMDYPHETTRTACDLIISGRKRQFPACKTILSCGRDAALLDLATECALFDSVQQFVDKGLAAWGSDHGGCEQLLFRSCVEWECEYPRFIAEVGAKGEGAVWE